MLELSPKEYQKRIQFSVLLLQHLLFNSEELLGHTVAQSSISAHLFSLEQKIEVNYITHSQSPHEYQGLGGFPGLFGSFHSSNLHHLCQEGWLESTQLINKGICPRIGYNMVKQNSGTQGAITSKITTVDITRMLHFKVTKLSTLLNFSRLWSLCSEERGTVKSYANCLLCSH